MSENTNSVSTGLPAIDQAKGDSANGELVVISSAHPIDPALTLGVTVSSRNVDTLADNPKYHRVHVEHPNHKPRNTDERRSAPRGDNDRRKPYGNKPGLAVDQGPARSRVVGLALAQALVAAGKNSTAFPKAPDEKRGGKKQHKRFNPKPAGAARDPGKPAKPPFRHNNKGNNRSVQTNRGK